MIESRFGHWGAESVHSSYRKSMKTLLCCHAGTNPPGAITKCRAASEVKNFTKPAEGTRNAGGGIHEQMDESR